MNFPLEWLSITGKRGFPEPDIVGPGIITHLLIV